MIAQIAVSAAIYAIDKPYSYLVPPSLSVSPGMRVLVPFGRGNRTCEGIVLALSESAGLACKQIAQVLDSEPVLSENMLRLAAFIRQRYYCTFFDAIRVMLPAGMWYRAKDTYTVGDLPDNWRTLAKRKPVAYAVLSVLVALGGTAAHSLLQQQFAAQALEDALRYLLGKKWISAQTDYLRKVGDKQEKLVCLSVSKEEAAEFARQRKKAAPMQAAVLEFLQLIDCCGAKELCYYTGATMATLNRLQALGCVEFRMQEVLRIKEVVPTGKAEPLQLNSEQQHAYALLREKAFLSKPGVGLLYGVTGSGKTAVYIRLIQDVLDAGRQAILLVPEIALTPQLLALFSAHFQQRVAVVHSALQIAQRYDTHKRIARGEADVIIGTRSAVFAPTPRLGLLIVDEEQEHSYRSENTPRYHARELAIFRGAQEHALVLLGSATPSIESMYHALQKDYTLYSLSKRYNERPLPPVQIVDMREQLRDGNNGAVSGQLQLALAETIRDHRQAILFLNRRGSSRFTVCVDCGYVPECPNCSVHLTYHQANGRLMCHHCAYSEPFPLRCPRCGGYLKQVGFGTQRVEQELKELFPNTEMLRMDADTVSAANPHEKLLQRFEKEKIPILIGTQMVTKGLNFENVTLVGVLNADAALYSSSFRAQETCFSLITQVVGRAGRGAALGRAIIQTIAPENPVIRQAAAQNYRAFYHDEIRLRRQLGYPPFQDLLCIHFSGLFEKDVAEAAAHFAAACRSALRQYPVRFLGPAPAPLLKVNNRYRYCLTLVCRQDRELRQCVAYCLQEFAKDKRNKGIAVFVDVNGYE